MMLVPDPITQDRVIVDTDVFSFVMRRHPIGESFRPRLMNKTLGVSFMTVAELYFGAYKADWGS